MMEEGSTAARIKQEIDSCCSPSPTSSNNNVTILDFVSSGQEPVSVRLNALLPCTNDVNLYLVRWNTNADRIR